MSQKKDPKRFYRIEARELLESLSRELLALSRGEERPEAVATLFRDAHTLKGAATVVGETEVVQIARILEDVLGEHRDAGQALEPQEVTEFLQMVEGLEALIRAEEEASQRASRAAAQADAELGEGAKITGSAPGSELRAQGEFSSDAAETVRVDLEDLEGVTANLAGAELQNRALASALREVDRSARLLFSLAEEMRGVLHTDDRAGVQSTSQRARFSEELMELVGQLGRDHREALSRADAVAHELRQARDLVGRLELVSVSTMFPSLERAAHLAASSVGKAVRFEVFGGETRVDRRVLPQVKDAMLHMLRNAVDHGIETEDQRLAVGKAKVGTVKVRVEPRGSRVAFICSDDGAGINVERVRAVAMARGLITEDIDDSAVLRLLFRAGVSTSQKVTDLSGRGVGLDVVGTAAAVLKGEANIHTELGVGTSVELVAPLSLSTALTIALEVGDASVLLPMDAVEAVSRLPASAIQVSSQGEMYVHEGELVPVLRLASALGLSQAAPEPHKQLAYLALTVESQKFCVVADSAQGILEAVVRPLPWANGTPLGVAGAAVDVDGGARLVLDPRGLLAILRGYAGVAPGLSPSEKARKYLPILVIDDSLTTRMLEQSILETAGFEVDIATCAEEGLTMAEAREYGLFVCDVEMPGMNGFQFTAQTRAHPRLRETQVILVTSLATEAHKKQGRDAGAAGYVVKGQFDQDFFLERVRTLLRVEA